MVKIKETEPVNKAQDILAKIYSKDLEFPLSYSQESFWLQQQASKSKLIHNRAVLLEFHGEPNPAALESSVQQFMERHQMARCTIHEDMGRAFQRIKEYEQVPVPVKDFRARDRPAERSQAFALVNLNKAFDLTESCIAFHILIVGPELTILQVLFHAIIGDAVTSSLIQKDIRATYEAILSDNANADDNKSLITLKAQYSDYVHLQRSENMDTFAKFWGEYLQKVDTLVLPRDGEIKPSLGKAASQIDFSIPSSLNYTLQKESQVLGVSTFALLKAALSILLARYSGQEDVTILFSRDGRYQANMQNLVGQFGNMLPLRTSVPGSIPFREYVGKLMKNLEKIYENQECSIQQIIQKVLKDGATKGPCFPVSVTMVPQAEDMSTTMDTKFLKHELEFYFNGSDQGEIMKAWVRFNPAAYSKTRMEHMVANFVFLLQSLLDNPEELIGAQEVVCPDEMKEIQAFGQAQGHQVCILGGSEKIVPIGVRGRIFQHSVDRMSETGNSGYWDYEGNLTVTGSLLTQVKVRGYTVQLDEVRAILLKYPGLTGATVKLGEDSELVASCNMAPGAALPNFDELYSFLRAHLPQHEVPSEIYVGQIEDELQLLVPNLELVEDSEEAVIAKMWADILKIPLETIGRGSNFFDLGGRSIDIPSLLTRLSEYYTVKMKTKTIFKRPVLKKLAEKVKDVRKILPMQRIFDMLGPGSGSQGVPNEEINFEDELKLGFEVDQGLPLPKTTDIFLTGCSGYLGAGTLVELLDSTEATIHCLIRGTESLGIEDKFHRAVGPYDLDSRSLSRVKLVEGDIGMIQFGLSDSVYEALAGQVASIYHVAAEVGLVKAYSDLRTSNVDGTREVLKFAAKSVSKVVHYVSTLGIFADQALVADEVDDGLVEELPLSHFTFDPKLYSVGYTASKYVAESLVWAAGKAGLRVIVYRPGEIGCHSQMNLYNRSDMFAMAIEQVIALKMAPEVGGNGAAPYASLDFVASAIVTLSLDPGNIGRAFHLIQYDVTFGDLFNILNEDGGLDVLGQEETQGYIQMLRRGKNPFLQSVLDRSMHALQNPHLTSCVKYSNAQVLKGLDEEEEDFLAGKDKSLRKYIWLIRNKSTFM